MVVGGFTGNGNVSSSIAGVAFPFFADFTAPPAPFLALFVSVL